MAPHDANQELIARLQVEIAHERTLRLAAEKERDTQMERAQRYHAERQLYKQRLREAAAAYTSLRETYVRLKNRGVSKRTLDPKDGNAGRAPAPESKETSIPCQSTLLRHLTREGPWREPNAGAPNDMGQFKGQDTMLLTQPILAPGSQPSSRPNRLPSSPCNLTGSARNRASATCSMSASRKPAWKKAVRHFDGQESKRGDASVGRDDGFGWSPIKVSRGSPVNSRAEAVLSGRTSARAPPPHVGYAHHQVVRVRDERARLPAFECHDCSSFYEALQKWGSVAVEAMPSCGHNVAADIRKEAINEGSRHRYRYKPPSTPVGYWNLGFSPPQKSFQAQNGGERRGCEDVSGFG